MKRGKDGDEDVFLVFVEGKPGREAAYAAWFAGDHMADMRALPGVNSAHAFQTMGTAPAALCAIYEFADGPGVLETIGRSKGTAALPHSEDQGRMTWRLFETAARQPEGPLPPGGEAVVALLETSREASDELSALDGVILAGGADYARALRLSPVQPARGSEYGAGLIVVWPEGTVDPAAATAGLLDNHFPGVARLVVRLVRTEPPASRDRS
jgi:hypothetical protein